METGTEPSPTGPRSGWRPAGLRAVPLVIASAMFMEQLDGTVLATALPAMAHSFGVDPAHMSIALTSYLVSLAVFIPASGRISDRLGTRTVFATAIALFTFGSILCGLSDSLRMLVASRLLQGAGGAMMVPVGRLVLLQTTAKSELIAVMNWLLVPATLGPLLGPPVGGFLVTTLDWRWIFYINVPIGLLGFLLAIRIVPQIRAARARGFDLRGMVLSGIAAAGLIFGLELISRGSLSIAASVAVLLVSAVAASLYAWHARVAADPILDFRLMRIPTFRLSVLAGSATRISVGATPYLLPLMLQVGLGMTAAQSGLTTFVTSFGGLSMRGFSRRLLRRFGYRVVMLWNGVGAGAFSIACATFRPPVHHLLIAAVLFCGGFFNALQFTAYNTIAYADVPAPRMSGATSLYATMQQMTLTLGICVAAAALAISTALDSHAVPRLADFSAAFLTVGAIALLAPLVSAGFASDAGHELSGHVVSSGRRVVAGNERDAPDRAA